MTKKQERNNLRPGRGISGRTMFSTVLLLFGIVINLNAQERTKVSFKFQKTTFEQVIQEIQKQTDYDFIYNSKAFPQKSFAIEAQNREVKSILDELSRDLGLEYTIMNKVITLRMKNTPSSSAPQSDQGLRIIKGKVVDEKGEPLPGVSVVVKNTVQGTASDVNGNFTIKPEGQEKIILQFSMIGMQRQEVEYKGEQELKIVMRENNETLNEVMVIGYGSTTRKDMTGSISSLDTKIIESSAAPNLAQMIQGQIPGLNIMLGDGSPGSPSRLEIRGASTLSSNSGPLIVVDDVPMSPDYDINMINSADIKSLNVLKGASATAIYGSRAAGGVIMITTKNNSRNKKPVIQYSFDFTNQRLVSDIRTLTADEFKTLLLEAARNEARASGYEDITQSADYQRFSTPGFFGESNTPWMSTLMQDAITMQHRVSIQGGTAETSYNASFSYLNEEGMLKSLYNKRYTYNAGFNTDISKKLKATVNVNGSFTRRNRNPRGMETAIAARPDVKVYNEDGSFYHQQYQYGGRLVTTKNPLAEITGTRDQEDRNNINLSTSLDWKPISLLNFSMRYSFQRYHTDYDYYASSETYEGSDNFSGKFNGYGKRTNYLTTEQEVEARASFTKTFKQKHYLNLMVAGTYNENNAENYWFAMDNFGDDNVQNGIWQGTEPYEKRPKDGYSLGSVMLSFIGRAEYKFMNRYILNASIRRDGSSKFSPKNRWGNFPAVAAAWLVSEEDFFKNNLPWFSYFKLKGGWGKVGNGWVTEYGWRTMFDNSAYLGRPAIIPSQVGNDDLKWEDTEAWDIGFEFGLFDNQRIKGSFGYYSKNTEGLLYDLTLSPSMGAGSTKVNFASIINKGVEFDLVANLISTKDWQWSVSANISKNKNRVTNIDAEFVSVPGSSMLTSTVIKEGSSLGLIYGFQTDGVFRSQKEIDYYESLNKDHAYQTGTTGRKTIPGDLKYVDQNNDGYVNIATTAKDDRVVLGYSRPDFEGGLSTRLGWKGFTLSIQSSYAYGHQKMWKAGAQQFQFNSYEPGNLLDIALKRWTPENPDSNYPSMRLNKYQNEVVGFAVYDASYWKIQNINLDYRVPVSWLKHINVFSSMTLSFSMNNVYTFTSYPGPSPESFSANMIEGGSIDYSTYPQTRNFNFSIKVTL